jgi:hypothetical protein
MSLLSRRRRQEARDQPAPGLLADARAREPVRLETGTRVTAVTDAGQAVEGKVVRVWQTFADSQAGAFRVLCGPDDSSDEEGRAS